MSPHRPIRDDPTLQKVNRAISWPQVRDSAGSSIQIIRERQRVGGIGPGGLHRRIPDGQRRPGGPSLETQS